MAADHPYPAHLFGGRGIVMCAGGARILTCAWVAINVLRRVLGCELPIELWHLGPRELSGFEAALFSPLGVDIIDALEVRTQRPARTLGGWELKPYALVHSRFEHVLLLDADNVPVIDPESLFELAQFVDCGTVAWPDLERLSEQNPIWELCGVPFRNEPSWESGQLLVDKPRCWHALQIALHMNMHSDSFYPYTNGDQDTFHLAWILAGIGWAMPEHPARWTTTGIFQRDFEGRLVFQHRTSAKWRLMGDNILGEHFRHQSECLRFIAELRERWSGRINPLPSPSADDQRMEDRVAQLRWFRLEEAGAEPRLLELLPENRIGVGSSRDSLLRWYFRDGALIVDGATDELPPLCTEDGAPAIFASAGGGRCIELRAAPEAGRDALGQTATAVLARFADDHAISEEEAVATLATLARVGDLTDALERARSRWRESDEAQQAIGRVAAQIGLRNAAPDLRQRASYLRSK